MVTISSIGVGALAIEDWPLPRSALAKRGPNRRLTLSPMKADNNVLGRPRYRLTTEGGKTGENPIG